MTASELLKERLNSVNESIQDLKELAWGHVYRAAITAMGP